MKEIECIVTGKVQGVGYREFAASKARGLWLFGFVENTGQFAVRVVAQGPEDKLDRFLEHLHKGPFLARVRDVEVIWREPTESFKAFTVTL
jgi:acylphosphatase